VESVAAHQGIRQERRIKKAPAHGQGCLV